MKFARGKKPRKDKKPRSNRRDSGEKSSGRFGRKDSGKRFGKRDSGKRSRDSEMHMVTCDKCKKKCEVPFKPTGDKPVYCSDCFRKDSKDKSGQLEKEFAQINEKLDRILKAIESN